MTMKSKFAEAVDTLADLKAQANLAASTLRVNCTCSEPEYRRDCPWYQAWRKSAAAASEYERSVRDVFSAGDAEAIVIRATANAAEPHFLA